MSLRRINSEVKCPVCKAGIVSVTIDRKLVDARPSIFGLVSDSQYQDRVISVYCSNLGCMVVFQDIPGHPGRVQKLMVGENLNFEQFETDSD